MNEHFPAESNGKQREKKSKGVCGGGGRGCVCGLHIYVEVVRGEVMSGIDPLLNPTPSHHNDDVRGGKA